MKFSVLAVLAIATGALAAPGGPQPPQPPKPPKAPKAPVKQFNNCGNDQSLYCCATNAQDSSVSCVSFTNGGIGGVCNGIQMCCNNNVNIRLCAIENILLIHNRDPEARAAASTPVVVLLPSHLAALAALAPSSKRFHQPSQPINVTSWDFGGPQTYYQSTFHDMHAHYDTTRHLRSLPCSM